MTPKKECWKLKIKSSTNYENLKQHNNLMLGRKIEPFLFWKTIGKILEEQKKMKLIIILKHRDYYTTYTHWRQSVRCRSKCITPTVPKWVSIFWIFVSQNKCPFVYNFTKFTFAYDHILMFTWNGIAWTLIWPKMA